ILEGGPDKRAFDHGIRANYREVFGYDRRLWFLPVFSSGGDGSVFRIRQLDVYTSGVRTHHTDTSMSPSTLWETRERVFATVHDNNDFDDRECFSLGDGIVFDRWDVVNPVTRYSLLTEIDAVDEFLLTASNSESDDDIV
ncbi:hypothetical protein Angca_010042, partial [Angiostrongylus cantonensis]